MVRQHATAGTVGHTGVRMRRKVVGPVVGMVACAAAGVVEWPVGALVYVFRRMKGRRIMSHPVHVVYPRVARAIPI